MVEETRDFVQKMQKMEAEMRGHSASPLPAGVSPACPGCEPVSAKGWTRATTPPQRSTTSRVPRTTTPPTTRPASASPGAGGAARGAPPEVPRAEPGGGR
eukprot:9732656-Lingulodinium_polyedra.AAC.1